MGVGAAAALGLPGLAMGPAYSILIKAGARQDTRPGMQFDRWGVMGGRGGIAW